MGLLRIRGSAVKATVADVSVAILFAACGDIAPLMEPDRAASGPSLVEPLTTDPAIFVGAGDIAKSGGAQAETAAILDHVVASNTAGYPLRIFTTGDNAYSDGTLQEFAEHYDPTWGALGKKALTSPTPGNHDYHTAGAAGYFEYFGAPAQGPGGEPYYSYDIGAWHAIALNSEIGVSAGDPQLLWLEADLQAEADQHMCTVAYWHQPLFSSGSHGNDSSYRDFWETLYAFGVDVVLAGHDHVYERFGPQDPYAVADPSFGIRQFIVGTGGSGLYDFSAPEPNSEIRYNASHGVLRLTLYQDHYEWEFIAVDGSATGSVEDSGSASCHGPPGGLPAPTAAFTWSCNGPDCAFTDVSSVTSVDSREWDFGDGIGPVGGGTYVEHSYAGAGTYEVTLTLTNADGSYSTSQSVTTSVIDLTAAWISGGGGREKVELTWTGASGQSVDVFRDGALLKTTRNDGALTDNASLATHVYQICEEGSPACSNEATAEYGSGGNQTPTANFSFLCSGLACAFTDESTDDGSITDWSWTFGDDGTSTAQDPSYTYAGGGSYTVTLTVTDDQGAADTAVRTVTVTETPSSGGITLTVIGFKDKGIRYAELGWSGVDGTDVTIRRDGVPVATTPNDGAYTDDLGRGGGESFTYQVCETGGSPCSNPVTVTF
jgi:PKD repeat protein